MCSASIVSSTRRPFTGPLFIVGMPRSGTKLVRDLLNQNSQVSICDTETEFLPWLARNAKYFGDLSKRSAFDRLYRRLAGESYFAYRAEAGRQVTPQGWHSNCRRFDVAGVFEGLIRSDVDAAYESTKIWGDKSPSYIDDLPLIDRLYPEARVLHIVRDVRDHCLSINHAWGKDMRRAAMRWTDGVIGARREGLKFGGRYMEVRYEDLLQDQFETLTKICKFIEIDFEPSMLQLPFSSENIGRTQGATRVVADNFGHYATCMDRRTILDLESLAAPAMLDFGYKFNFPLRAPRRSLSFIILIARVGDALQLIRHRSKGRGIMTTILFHVRHFVSSRG